MAIDVDWVQRVASGADGVPRGHLCEPRLLRLASGAVLLSHRAGSRRESADGSPGLLRSDDGGASWASLGLPFERERPEGWDFRRASLAQLPSGNVLAVILAIDKSSGLPVHNPATGGALPIHAFFARSSNEGRTWSPLWPLEDVSVPQLAAEQLLALPGGDVLCTYERFKHYDDSTPWRYQGGLIRSRDGGARWGDAAVAAASDPDNDPENTMWWDPRIARLSDGRLVQFYHAYRYASGREGPVHVAWSLDDGRSWTQPTPTTLLGQVAYPVALPGGHVLVLQQRRFEPQTIVATLSRDGGRTFDSEETIVYHHDDESAPGADGSLAPVAYLQSMDRFTFGHPTGVALAEASRVLAAWYAGGLERTTVFAALLRIRES